MQMRHSDQHIHNCTIADQPSTVWLQSNGIVHDVATFDQFQSLNIYLKMFYLASSYFLRGLPPKYRRR